MAASSNTRLDFSFTSKSTYNNICFARIYHIYIYMEPVPLLPFLMCVCVRNVHATWKSVIVELAAMCYGNASGRGPRVVRGDRGGAHQN